MKAQASASLLFAAPPSGWEGRRAWNPRSERAAAFGSSFRQLRILARWLNDRSAYFSPIPLGFYARRKCEDQWQILLPTVPLLRLQASRTRIENMKTSRNPFTRLWVVSLFLLVLLGPLAFVRADQIEMQNGDRYFCKVVFALPPSIKS